MLRSEKQNKYFHGPLLDALTPHIEMLSKKKYTRKEVKEMMKMRFLKNEVVVPSQDGKEEILEHISPTSSLSTAEFENFTDEIRRWAASTGLSIKEPNE